MSCGNGSCQLVLDLAKRVAQLESNARNDRPAIQAAQMFVPIGCPVPPMTVGAVKLWQNEAKDEE